MQHEMEMKIPLQSYLLNALWSWINDNGCTPMIAVDASVPGTEVPRSVLKPDGTVILNISMSATGQLVIKDDGIRFNARFNGKHHSLFVPLEAVKAIFARETGAGMHFSATLMQDETASPSSEEATLRPVSQTPPPPAEPAAVVNGAASTTGELRRYKHLTVVK